jgi:hypothetical protein
LAIIGPTFVLYSSNFAGSVMNVLDNQVSHHVTAPMDYGRGARSIYDVGEIAVADHVSFFLSNRRMVTYAGQIVRLTAYKLFTKRLNGVKTTFPK